MTQRHSYHLVDPSPWPISGSLGALATTVGGVMYMHSFTGGSTLLSLGLIFILYTMFVWWRDVIRESTLEGHHTKVVQFGLRYGFILFIVSEVMFFFAFFWAFFHSSLAPAVEILFHSPFLSFFLFQVLPFIFIFRIVFSTGELSFRILLFCWSLQKYVLAVVPKRYHFILFIIFHFLRGWFIVIVGLTIIDLVPEGLVQFDMVALRGQIDGMLFYLGPDLFTLYLDENPMELNGIDVIIGGTLEIINPAEPPDDPSTPSAPPRPPEIKSPPLSPSSVPRNIDRTITTEHTEAILNRGFLWGVQGHTPNIVFVDHTICPAVRFLPTLGSSELEELYHFGERRCLGEGVYTRFVWHHFQGAIELEMLARVYGPRPGPIS